MADLDDGAAELVEDEGGDGAGECAAVFVVGVLGAEKDVRWGGGVNHLSFLEEEGAGVDEGVGGDVE